MLLLFYNIFFIYIIKISLLKYSVFIKKKKKVFNSMLKEFYY